MESQGAAADAGAVAEAADGGAQGVDLQPVLERLGQVAEQVEGFGARIDALTPQQEAEAEEGFSDFDLSGLDYEGMDEAQAQQVLQSLVDQRLSPALEQAVGPLAQQIQQMQVESDARQLMEQYPELQNPEVAQAVTGRAAELAQEIGSPELGQSRAFIELVHKAMKADQQSAGEVPVSGLEQHGLEGGAGAAPGGGEGPSIASQIVGSRSRGSAFWGA